MAALSEAGLPERTLSDPKSARIGVSVRISAYPGIPPCRPTVVTMSGPPSPKLGHWSPDDVIRAPLYAKTPEFRGFVQVLRRASIRLLKSIVLPTPHASGKYGLMVARCTAPIT